MAWLTRWQTKYPELTNWVEAHIGKTLTFYRLPRAHHKHLKSANMLKRLNEAIKRRTRVVRIFPNTESCLRLVRALCVETHERWLEDNRTLNMDLLKEQRRKRPDEILPHAKRKFAQLDGHNRRKDCREGVLALVGLAQRYPWGHLSDERAGRPVEGQVPYGVAYGSPAAACPGPPF